MILRTVYYLLPLSLTFLLWLDECHSHVPLFLTGWMKVIQCTWRGWLPGAWRANSSGSSRPLEGGKKCRKRWDLHGQAPERPLLSGSHWGGGVTVNNTQKPTETFKALDNCSHVKISSVIVCGVSNMNYICPTGGYVWGDKPPYQLGSMSGWGGHWSGLLLHPIWKGLRVPIPPGRAFGWSR